jgi:hypothetical protein
MLSHLNDDLQNPYNIRCESLAVEMIEIHFGGVLG